MGTMYTILQTLFFLAGLLLIILILLRKSEVSGLSGAFGGVGGDTAFGVKAQKQLDKIITYVAVFFLVTAILLNTPSMRVKVTPTPTPTPPTQEGTKK